MKSSMQLTVVGGLLLLSVVLEGSAQAQTSIPRALLRVHSSFSQGGHGLHLADGDLFVATDRTVLGIVSRANNAGTLPPPWTFESKAATGSPRDFATLVAVLADNRIAQQTGDCSLVSAVSPADSGSFEITWYSRGLRKKVILAEINGSLPPCAPEIARILSGIVTYALAGGVPVIVLSVEP